MREQPRGARAGLRAGARRKAQGCRKPWASPRPATDSDTWHSSRSARKAPALLEPRRSKPRSPPQPTILMVATSFSTASHYPQAVEWAPRIRLAGRGPLEHPTAAGCGAESTARRHGPAALAGRACPETRMPSVRVAWSAGRGGAMLCH